MYFRTAADEERPFVEDLGDLIRLFFCPAEVIEAPLLAFIPKLVSVGPSQNRNWKVGSCRSTAIQHGRIFAKK
jgi:hypothetical protein